MTRPKKCLHKLNACAEYSDHYITEARKYKYIYISIIFMKYINTIFYKKI